MCYTGACVYETYPYGYNEGCVCRRPAHGSCPCESDDQEERDNELHTRPCPKCGQAMMESIIPDCSGGTHRELDGYYCEDCDYSELAED